MKLLTRIAFLVALVFLTGAAQKAENKLPASTLDILTKSEKVELLSLNPNTKEKVNDGFHGYPVLGKTMIKEVATRKQLVEGLTKGMEGNIVPARCFIPRHGIIATHEGKTVELVICFECSQFVVHEGKEKGKWFLVSKAPEPAFDKVLSDAGIPKAK